MQHFYKASEIGTRGASTLPSAFYTSEDIFDREQDRVFGQRWICAGREEQIPGAGDYFLRQIGRDSVIVLRDERGAVRAFYNVCRHRGTRICTTPAGRFAKRIQCPYHAWNYALDGRLMGAPSMDDCPEFDKQDFPLNAVAVATWEGFVFISLSENPEPFEQAFAPLIGKFGRFQLSHIRREAHVAYDVRANWKLIVQNYSECYHCPSVHPALVQLSPADSGENDLVEGPFLGGFMVVPQAGGSLTISGNACSIPVGDLPAEDRQRVYYYSIFPSMLLSMHHDYVMVHTLWPQAPDRTWIECDWYFHPQAPQQQGYRPEDATKFWDMTNRQDWEMCELSQLGIASRGYRPAPYSPRESLLAAFDRELLKALSMTRDGL